MPKISFYERDLTVTQTVQDIKNVAYVPGYANIGPINTPVLCTSLDEFQNLFGTQPYKFEATEKYPSGFEKYSSQVYAYKDTYEKSFIYATKLLNKGLPILFERCMQENTDLIAKKEISIQNSTDKLVLKAKYQGKYGNLINVQFLNTITEYYLVPNDIDSLQENDIIKTGSILKANSKLNDVTYNTDTTLLTDITIKNTSGNKIVKGSKLTAQSKVNGQLISINDKEISEDDYIVTITLNKNDTYGITKSKVEVNQRFNFDINSEYYYKKLNSNILDIEVLNKDGVAIDFEDINAQLDLTSMSYDLATTGSEVEFTINYLYTQMDNNLFTKLLDTNQYLIKFITSGSYPVLEYSNYSIVTKMLSVAGKRRESIAVIDPVNDVSRDIVSTTVDTTLYDIIQKIPYVEVNTTNKPMDGRKYGTIISPWGIYKDDTYSNITLPGSYAYLSATAVSSKTNESQYAVAGITRGYIDDLIQVTQTISALEANEVQVVDGISFNPIVNIKPYGYCIWGNRTLNNNAKELIASSFLNVRSMVCDIVKKVRDVCTQLTFENDTDILWVTFKSKIEPYLERIKSDNGLLYYKLTRLESTKRATVLANIKLRVVEAVEDFDITMDLTDSYVNVE